MNDPYYCTDCHYNGSYAGVIQMLTCCERCKSLHIVPLATAAMLGLSAQDFSPKPKRHLRSVPNLRLIKANDTK